MSPELEAELDARDQDDELAEAALERLLEDRAFEGWDD